MDFRVNLLLFYLCLAMGLDLRADPWGKDADLAQRPQPATCLEKKCSTPLLGRFAETMIAFHQKIISPADGPRSHFVPSSSQYTLDAMRRYGFFRDSAWDATA